MKKRFTMLLASLLLVVGTAWAQTETMEKGPALSAAELNALSEATDVVIQNVSGTNKWYLAGDKNVQSYEKNSEAWLVVEPVLEDGQATETFYLKKKYPSDGQGEGYLQKAASIESNVTIGAKSTAQLFSASATTISEDNLTAAAAGDEKYIRFLLSGTENRINCNATGSTPYYCGNNKNGGYTIQNVYTISEKLVDITISEVNSIIADAWTTSTWTTLENVPEDAVAAVQGNGGDYESLTSEALKGFSQTVQVPEGGNLSVAFVYGGGNNRLDIAGVDWLDANGNVAYSDYHYGYSGGNKVNNIYTAYNVAAGIYTMRYWVVFGPEANTSNGNIKIASWNIDTDKTYRLKSKTSGLYLEIADFEQTSGEGAVQLKNKALHAGQLFAFGKGDGYVDGQYNLSSVKEATTYYVNAASWNFYAGTESTTPFTIAIVAGESDVVYSLYQSTAAYKGYAGNINGNLTDGAYVYNNQNALNGSTTWVLEEVDKAEFETALADLLAEANALAGYAVLEGTEELTALNEAIAAANDLGATPELDALVSVVNNLQIVVPEAAEYIQQNDISYITALTYTENSNHPVLVNNARSNWGVADNATALRTLAQLGLAKSETDTKQQFAFITPDGGKNYYLYSVHAQRYLKSDNTFCTQGEPVAFADASAQGANRVQVRFRDVASKYFNVGGSNQMTIDGWSDIDAGNACEIVQYNALEFDLDYALKVFNEGAEVTIRYMHEGTLVLSRNELLFVGDTKTIPCEWDYTTIESITVDGVSVDAPAEGNDWTFTIDAAGPKEVKVNLVYNTPFALTVENDTTWHMLKIRPSSGKWVKRADTAPYPDNTERPTDDNGLWAFTGNPVNGIQVLNKAAGEGYTLSYDNTNNGAAVYMKEETTTWTLEEAAKGFLLRHGTTGNKYVHDYGDNLKFWDSSSAPTDEGSALVVVSPLTIKYMLGGVEQEDLRVEATDYAYGTEVTIANPYANKYIAIGGIETTGSQPKLEDDKWSVTVTKETELTVTLVEDLPFKVSTNYDVVWHYMQMNSNGWKYVKSNHGNNTTSTTNTAELDDASLWAFVGDALNGFKILNKAVSADSVLYVASTDDGTAAYMSNEAEMKWTIEKGNGGFVIRQGEAECLNDYAGGGVMKIWNAAGSPNGAGSAFQAIEYGLRDLSELANPMSIGIYTLQAERSPLLYSTTEGMTTKLSSGLVDGVAADEKDVNQHFLFLRTGNTPEGYFYLYSVGAKMFVDADLNFTDFPTPVLSLEPYAGTNSTVYPWWVKIADKYVIPGNGGTDGNKIYHTEGGDDDDGKRYRIVKVGTYTDYSVLTAIEQAEDMIKQVSELSNEKVYTVSTYDRGYWYYNTEADSALWSTAKAGVEEVSSSDANVQFAFLTVSGHTYIYSIGAQKFVVKKNGYTTYSDEPTQPIELLDAQGTKFYPFVAAFVNGENRHHIGISNSYAPPVITFYNDLNDGGNKIKLREVTSGYMAEGAEDLLAAAVAKIEDYLVTQVLKPELLALINRANELLGLGYLDAEDTGALTNAKTTAQGVYDNDAATSGQLTEQVELLTEAITAVTYVREVEDFKNAYVYTFVSKRGWMGADGTDGVISGTGAADNTNYQWAVYKSERGYSYLYNIGKAQFMGVETRNETQMPFSATPQTTGLTFKKSAWTDYPIMFSMDNQFVVNNNKVGQMICWTGGWNNLEDDGSNHQVAIVGALAEETLTTIAEAVNRYEAIQALETAIAAAQAKVDEMSDAIGYYSSSIDNVDTKLEAIVAFKEGITESTTVPEIEEQTVAAEEIAASFSLNLPEAGKFYRFSYDYGDAGVKYVQAVASGVANKTNGMVMTEDQGAASIFYYADSKLLSYSAGQYVRDENDYRGLQDVDAAAGAASFTASTVLGKLYIFAGASFHANKSNDVYFVDHCGSGHNPEHNFTVEEVTTLPVAVSAAGYATLYAPVSLQIPAEGVKVYTAEVTDTYVSLIELEGNVIPANTGVMLEAGEGSYDFTVVADAPDGITSDFVGACPKSNMKDGVKTYTLQKPTDGEVGFYRFKGTKPINGFRAWVELPSESNAQALRIRFGRGEGTTAIDELEATANGQQPTAVYDLAGRRVLNPAKGMYIVNGKKVVIK